MHSEASGKFRYKRSSKCVGHLTCVCHNNTDVTSISKLSVFNLRIEHFLKITTKFETLYEKYLLLRADWYLIEMVKIC
jgi:hypothetical protein